MFLALPLPHSLPPYKDTTFHVSPTPSVPTSLHGRCHWMYGRRIAGYPTGPPGAWLWKANLLPVRLARNGALTLTLRCDARCIIHTVPVLCMSSRMHRPTQPEDSAVSDKPAKWHSIASAPIDTHVLLWVPSGKGAAKDVHVIPGRVLDNGHVLFANGAKAKGYPSHWMDMPPNPPDAYITNAERLLLRRRTMHPWNGDQSVDAGQSA